MTQIRFGELECQRALAKLDSYIDGEPLTDSNLELMEHLQRCTVCMREMVARRNLRAQLQAAVREVRVPSGLEGRVRDRLRETWGPQSKLFKLLAMAAVVAVCFGSWFAFQRQAIRPSTATHEPYVDAVSGQLATTGLGNHLHCAVVCQLSNLSRGAVDNSLS